MTTKERLRAFMAEHRNECREYSLEDISKAIGCTRERVRQLMPAYGDRRLRARRLDAVRTLQAFVEKCPEALLPVALGGTPLNEIARRAGLTNYAAGIAWAELELPKRITLKEIYGVPHSHTNEYARRRDREVSVIDECVNCGSPVELSRARIRNFNNGAMKRIVCGISCGIFAANNNLPRMTSR